MLNDMGVLESVKKVLLKMTFRARGCRCLVPNKARRRHVKEIKDCRPDASG